MWGRGKLGGLSVGAGPFFPSSMCPARLGRQVDSSRCFCRNTSGVMPYQRFERAMKRRRLRVAGQVRNLADGHGWIADLPPRGFLARLVEQLLIRHAFGRQPPLQCSTRRCEVACDRAYCRIARWPLVRERALHVERHAVSFRLSGDDAVGVRFEHVPQHRVASAQRKLPRVSRHAQPVPRRRRAHRASEDTLESGDSSGVC